MLLPIADVALPAHSQHAAARERGAQLGVVVALGAEVLGPDDQVGDGEAELLGQGVVGIGQRTVLHQQTAYVELNLALLACGSVGNFFRLFALGGVFRFHQAADVGVSVPLLVGGGEAVEVHLGDVEVVGVEVDVVHFDAQFLQACQLGILGLQVHIGQRQRGGDVAFQQLGGAALEVDMRREVARHLVEVDHVLDIAFHVAQGEVLEVHRGVEGAAGGVVVGVHVEASALVEREVQASFGLLLATDDEAGDPQVHVGQVQLLFASEVAVAEAGVTDANIVEFQRPAAGRGVFLLVGFVTLEVVDEAVEIEAVAVLLHLGFESGEGDVAQVDGLEGQLQQRGARIEGVEAGEARAAVVLIEVEPLHLDASGQQVHPHTLHLHAAAGQLFAMLVDITFGDGARHKRHDDKQRQHDADHPEYYFDNLLHILYCLNFLTS